MYKAEDIKLKRAVALKFLPSQAGESHERFLREAQAVASLNHPNICTIHEIDEEHGFIAMEFIEGASVKEKIEARPLPLDEALHIATQACTGLQAAHDKGIVHRDIKPANLMLTAEGQVKVMDFGLAQIGERTRITKTGSSIGTPAYMSPEQTQGQPADRRTDIWSIGVVLFEMVTGRLPFAGKTDQAISFSIVHAQPEPVTALRSGLPVELDRIVAKALAKSPEERYQNIADLIVDLRRVATTSRQSSSPQTGSRRSFRRAYLWAAVLVLAVAGFFIWRALSPARSAALTDKDTIVVADFANSTGEPIFNDTLRQGLEVQLQQSPFLSIVPDNRIEQTLELMGKPKTTPLTGGVARDVCERTSSVALLEGSISTLVSQYILGLRTTNCLTGAAIDQQQVQVARKEGVIDAITKVAAKFREGVGESLATRERYSTPLEEAATPSLEALKAFSLAGKVLRADGHLKALPLFQRAVEIDPEFASAHAWLGRMYAGIGEFSLGLESAEKAWQYRRRASDHERFYIDFSYYRQVKGDLEKSAQTLEAWAQSYPRDFQPHGFLSGSVSLEVGKFERAVEEGQKAIALDPDVSPVWANIAFADLLLDKMAEAKAVLQKAENRKFTNPELLITRYQIAFLENDQKELARLTEAGYKRSATFASRKHTWPLMAVSFAGLASCRDAASNWHGMADVWSAPPRIRPAPQSERVCMAMQSKRGARRRPPSICRKAEWSNMAADSRWDCPATWRTWRCWRLISRSAFRRTLRFDSPMRRCSALSLT